MSGRYLTDHSKPGLSQLKSINVYYAGCYHECISPHTLEFEVKERQARVPLRDWSTEGGQKRLPFFLLYLLLKG